MIGKVLGDRYEIVEKVGSGGMSVVYKAKCRLLNRFVAIKILRQEFVDNEEFIKRFRVEAQAAASLSHPNIVSIYDVGNQDDLYYIVMEYVDGVTLKEYIVYKKVLDWKETLKVSMQICSALEHAHKNGIVHRDIKPHNIIITTDGVVKVTDFGIARATTYFTVTFAGNAIGSVHYFSPEQARGGYTDNRTDIYSLGVVMYEMLTGKLPFEGDSPVAIAFQHIEKTPVEPIELNSDVPMAINGIIVKAMSKEAEKRYSTVTKMLNDLNEALKHPNEIVAEINTVDDKGDSPTLVIPAVSTNKTDKKETQNKVKVGTKTAKTRNKKKLAIIAVSILTFAILMFGAYKLLAVKPSAVAVPNLVGKTEGEANNLIVNTGLTLAVKARRSDENFPAGIIIEQSPGSGMSVIVPYKVEVVVSSGKKEVQVPAVEKKDYREAKVEIEKLGLTANFTYEPSDTIPIGFVTRLNPTSGTTVNQGTSIEVFVSNGPNSNTIPMPNLIGLTEQKAKASLSDAKLSLGSVTYTDNTAAYGTVVYQSVNANSAVSEGTKINLKLSNGIARQTIKVALPKDRNTVAVEAKLIFSKGVETTAYPKTVISTSQSPLAITVSGTGKAHLLVYFDGKLSSEQDINFGEAR